jgi:hypothetical protein
LTDVDGQQHVVSFDQMGNPISEMPGPARANAILDPTIVNLDSDADGNVFVTYGVPPYQVWRLSADGSGIDTIGRDLDQPADTILVSDIACDRRSGILWVLLGIREQGLQTIDAFSPDGRLVGSFGIPLSESILNVACACDSGLYLVNTGGTGPSSGDLLRISALLV